MQGMFSATLAKLLEFDPVRIVPAVLLGRVVPLLALRASEVNDHANILLRHTLYYPFGLNEAGRGPPHLIS